MDYWKSTFSTEANGQITAAQDSLIVSILSAGTFFGALTAAPIGDLLGRRIGLMASAGIVFNFGVILQTAATTQPLFIAGRFFAGYGVGLISALSKYCSITAFRRHSNHTQFPCTSPRLPLSGFVELL
jgi:MFS family permease